MLKDIYQIIDNGKGSNIVAFECSDSYYVDFVVIVSCMSTRHGAGISEMISHKLKHEYGIICNIDASSPEWIAIDCMNIMVHIMTEAKRMHYSIDNLIDDLECSKKYDLLSLSA